MVSGLCKPHISITVSTFPVIAIKPDPALLVWRAGNDMMHSFASCFMKAQTRPERVKSNPDVRFLVHPFAPFICVTLFFRIHRSDCTCLDLGVCECSYFSSTIIAIANCSCREHGNHYNRLSTRPFSTRSSVSLGFVSIYMKEFKPKVVKLDCEQHPTHVYFQPILSE